MAIFYQGIYISQFEKKPKFHKNAFSKKILIYNLEMYMNASLY